MFRIISMCSLHVILLSKFTPRHFTWLKSLIFLVRPRYTIYRPGMNCIENTASKNASIVKRRVNGALSRDGQVNFDSGACFSCRGNVFRCRCLAMYSFSESVFPAFSRHVTILSSVWLDNSNLEEENFVDNEQFLIMWRWHLWRVYLTILHRSTSQKIVIFNF
jgi:hypothetical protein